jgi:intracellular sulfur oxidation DsrE/DsrF family protein
MSILKTTTHRRGFLGGLAAGAASLGVAALTAPFKALAEAGKGPQPSGDTSFEAWLGQIKGKHRQVFDAPALNEGMPFAWPRVFYMTNKQLGIPESELTVIVILRHDAIPLALDHPLWEQYGLGEFFHINDAKTKAAAKRNPYYKPAPGELLLPDMSIEELQKSGVMFGACDMALTVYSRFVGEKVKEDPEQVKSNWVKGVLPGMQIVPSGVLAVNRAQELGCTYCFAG